MNNLLTLFTAIDFAAIGKIIAIDIMLGVDNAIVIALACAGLPANLRTRAVVLGTLGAILLRACLLGGAGLLFGLPVIKAVAGAYLIYIGIKLLRDNNEEDSSGHHVNNPTTIVSAIKVILIADFMMSLDNVLAVVGAAQSTGAHATLYAITGILFSIPIIVFGAQGIMKLMDRFAVIMWIGGGLLGWVGVEMILNEPLLINAFPAVEHMGSMLHTAIKAMGFALVIAAGLITTRRISSTVTEKG